MSKIKELLKLCERFKFHMNIGIKEDDPNYIKDVRIFSGIKQAGYNIPMILDYLNYPPYSNRGSMIEMAWYVEIFINGICIWRKFHVGNPNKKEDLKRVEAELCEKIINEIQLYGLFHSRKRIMDMNKNKNILNV